MKVKPLHDRILVKRLEEGEQVVGGIIIPDTAKEKPQQGKVVAVGAGKIDEVRVFDKKLQGLDEGDFSIRVPWKDAAKQSKGWSPDVDDGVKVNILPLQTAGLLRIARVVSAASEENE